MGVRTYQAYSISEALDAAKRDLGADAVVLETRTFTRGGFLGLGRRPVIELTASSAERAGPPRPAARAREAYRRGGTGSQDRDRVRGLAAALAAVRERRRSDEAPPVAAAPEPPPRREERRADGTVPAVAAPAERVARRFTLTPADAPASAAAWPPAPPADAPAMREELAAIRELVERALAGTRAPSAVPALPPRLGLLHGRLLEQGLAPDLADRVARAVRQELPVSALDDAAAVREAVLHRLASLVPAAEPAEPRRSPHGRPWSIALVGPTGVGKTTTLAKLAASFKLRRRLRVGLLTCDTYRIAAVDQLRTYANIIGVPLEVALSPAEMAQASQALDDCDVVLIDTAGRAPDDGGRLAELRRCLDAAAPDEVHLVLSGTASEPVLMREAEAFSRVRADRLLVTKLDETVSFGTLINIMQKVGRRLSFVTTGQEVPDHIEVGRPRRLAELVLGAAVHA